MKKLIFTCLIVCFLAAQGFTQNYSKGDNLVGFGIGIGGNLYAGYWGTGIKRTPTILASYERCIVDHLWDKKSSIGVGGIMGYASAKYDAGYGYGWKCTNFIIGVRGALHYAVAPKFDAYAGVALGYNVVSWKWTGDWVGEHHSTGSSGFTGSGFIGARYYFTKSLGAFAEVGYGFSILNLGLSLKF
jgi:hypothetical protein